jgi:hypothetical protein
LILFFKIEIEIEIEIEIKRSQPAAAPTDYKSATEDFS